MSEISDIVERVANFFDGEVRKLGQEEYREVLDEVIADLQCKLDCVTSELEAAGVD